MQIDFAEARRFISALTGDPRTSMHWQLFNDSQKGLEGPGFYGPLEGDIVATLTHYQKLGYGVHAAINQTDGKRRRKENVVKVRACYVDGDGAPVPTKWPATPHIFCSRTATRWHAYWLLDESESKDFHGWKDCQAWLAANLGGDKGLLHHNGTLRIPGFLHQKDASKPSIYRMFSDLTGVLEPYRYADLRKAFPLSVEQEDQYRRIMFPAPKPELDPEFRLGTADDPDMVEAAKGCLGWIDASEGRNQAAFKVGIVCGDFNLTPETAYEIAVEHIDFADEDDTRVAVNNAYRYRKNPIGYRCPEVRKESRKVQVIETLDSIGPMTELSHDSHVLVDFAKPLMKKGETPNRSAENIRRALSSADIGLAGKCYYDEFAESIRWDPAVKIPFEMNDYKREDPYGFVTDADIVQLRCYLDSRCGLDVPQKDLDLWITALARQNAVVHPVKRFIEGVPWDGKPRMHSLFTYYCNANPTGEHPQPVKYLEWAAVIFLVSCISRIYKPGCKCDVMLILEGKQGIGKSTLFEVLGGEWYDRIRIDLTSASAMKDTFLLLRNKWILENAELDSHYKENKQMKAFIDQATDTYRPPYASRPLSVRRRCVIGGSTNPERIRQYTDQTGERRKLPVYIDGVQEKPSVRLEELARDRQQLFAEAYSFWRLHGDIFPAKLVGERWGNAFPLFQREQELRMKAPRFLDECVTWFEATETQEELTRGQAIPFSRIIFEVLQRGTTHAEERDRAAIASVLELRLGLEVVQDKYGRESYMLPEYFSANKA